MFLVSVGIKDYDYKRKVENTIILVGVIQTLYAILQYLNVLEWNNPLFHFSGSFMNPGPLGGYLSLAIVILIAQWKSSDRIFLQEALTKLFLGIILLIGLICSQSRAAWTASVVGIIYIYVRHSKISNLRKVAYSFIPVIIVLTMYFIRRTSADGRLLIWKICINNIVRHLFLGYGPMGFHINYMNWQGAYFECPNRSVSEMLLACDNVHVYNTFLHILVEYGIVGLVVFVFAIIFIFAKVSKAVFEPAHAGFLSLITFSCFSYPEDNLVLYLLFSLLCGLSLNREPNLKLYLTKWIHNSLGILFLTISILAILGCYVEHLRSNNIKICVQQTDLLASVLWRNNPGWHFSKAEYNYKIGLYKDAIIDYNATACLFPRGETYIKMGNCYLEEKQYRQALVCYRKAERMLPANLAPVYLKFQVYLETNDLYNANLCAQKLISMPIKVRSSRAGSYVDDAKHFIINYSKE